ncbi:SLATT domain-containing protein [Aeromonas caviae]|uniref:SLATT domain-containing protein n=1 Tax=Aeromonas caviae TaxID=648 RepID=UPI002AB4F902|nr:SLATT domain-containing protein [Aeromonas caviae]MDY7782516.1 SLATT domain-containing protein [Aeromonas caviae]
MKKSDLLKSIAEKGYDIGFGAKKHFATYDIIEKTPGLISFISMAIGIYALCVDSLSTKIVSATFIVLGVVGLYISMNIHKKNDYEKAGSALTRYFNEMKSLYIEVKGLEDEANLDEYLQRLKIIENKFYSESITKQIMFSNWYAHYKFFWEHQINWIDEQLHFKFFRDKIPLSLSITLITLLIVFLFSVKPSLDLICGASNF